MKSADPPAPRIAFRTDASLEIGTGHVMRCLTLADVLRQRGSQCLFISRRHQGHLIDHIAALGYQVVALPAPRSKRSIFPGEPAHAAWLGVDWQEDAAEVEPILAERPVSWLVVDHYGLDRSWERAMRSSCQRIMVMDDLADRSHDCDLLLDPTLMRSPAEYRDLVPGAAKMLLGPENALLRPEFAAARAESLARRQSPRLRQLLVTMGGIDKDNATSRVLDALEASDLAPSCRITVVLGQHAPWLIDVELRAQRIRIPTRVLSGVKDMARLMVDSDLAIGAAGGTSWERCCLGLPSIVLVLAHNQELLSRRLAQAGGAVVIERPFDRDFGDRLQHHLSRFADDEEYRRMTELSSAITQGKGADIVADEMLGSHLKLRSATSQDAKQIWQWREAGDAWRFYRSCRPTALHEHILWFEQALENPRIQLLVVHADGVAKAHLRFDLAAEGCSEISICVASAFRGQNLGKFALALAKEHAAQQGWKVLRAEVHEDNVGSMRIFAAAGFRQTGTDGQFAQFEYRLSKSGNGESTIIEGH